MYSFFSNNQTLQAIRNGFVVTMPLFLAGALGLLFVNFPVPAYQDFMASSFGPGWQTLGFWIYNATFGILSLIIAFSVSYNLCEQYNDKYPLRQINPIICSMVSFSIVLLLMQPLNPLETTVHQWSGVSGLFVSIITTTLATSVMLMLSRIRSLRLRISAETANQIIPQTFEALIPALITLVLFLMIKLLINEAVSYIEASLSSHGDLVGIQNPHELVYHLLKISFAEVKNELGGALLYTILSQIAWFFGIHGPNLLDPITHDIYTAASAQNFAAAHAGKPLPNIVTKEFFDHFVYSGGSGATLGLIFSILFLSRDAGNRRVGQLSLLPGIFNINETVIFGLPIIINPVFVIPFLATPVVLTMISYAAIYFGLVPATCAEASWTTPTLISGYIVTGSWTGVALQAVNLALSILIYTPFVMLSDRGKQKRFKDLLGDLLHVATSNTIGPRGKKCIDRGGGIGVLARGLANDLEQAIKKNSGLYLLFQPQVYYQYGLVSGVEALLRWNHPIYGEIPAPITIAVAEDSMLIEPLGLLVFDYACSQRSKWRDSGITDIKISVNVSVNQLSDPLLLDKIIEILQKYDLPADMMELEVTESIALDPDASYLTTLQKMDNVGLKLAIDDFGMGHASLTYIKHFPVSTLKLDASLSKDVLNDVMSQEVIITITEFCNAMNITTVVEFVESEEQLNLLRRLGCKIFQGYFFSPPISGDACLSFIRNYRQEQKSEVPSHSSTSTDI